MQRLRQQCENLELPLIAPPPLNKSSFPMAPDAQTNAFKRALNNADLVLDCIFGKSQFLACQFSPVVSPPNGRPSSPPCRSSAHSPPSGFSFHPPTRAPFDVVLNSLATTEVPILSVDIPSGWDVMDGNSNDGFTPNAIISLTAPKVGVKEFAEAGGTHYLGGRFISGQMDLKYGLNLPQYSGTSQCVDITTHK